MVQEVCVENLSKNCYERYQSELPQVISIRKHLKHSELVKLMTWKLTVSWDNILYVASPREMVLTFCREENFALD